MRSTSGRRCGDSWPAAANCLRRRAPPFCARSLFNHWYHHRGQLLVYLRPLDLPVPSCTARPPTRTRLPECEVFLYDVDDKLDERARFEAA